MPATQCGHFVVDAIDDERGLMVAPEIAEAGPRRLLPLTERHHLRGCDARHGCGVEVLCALCKPLDKCSAGRLARRRQRAKKSFCNTANPVSVGSARCARLGSRVSWCLRRHAGLSRPESCGERSRAVLSHLLHDHAAEREPEDVAAPDLSQRGAARMPVRGAIVHQTLVSGAARGHFAVRAD